MGLRLEVVYYGVGGVVIYWTVLHIICNSVDRGGLTQNHRAIDLSCMGGGEGVDLLFL